MFTRYKRISGAVLWLSALAWHPAAAETPFSLADARFKATHEWSCKTDAMVKGASKDGISVGGTVQVVNGQLLVWCYDATHTWLGTLSYADHTFTSDPGDPLQFRVDRKLGYVYVKGRGTVMLPDGHTVNLPPFSTLPPQRALTPVAGDRFRMRLAVVDKAVVKGEEDRAFSAVILDIGTGGSAAELRLASPSIRISSGHDDRVSAELAFLTGEQNGEIGTVMSQATIADKQISVGERKFSGWAVLLGEEESVKFAFKAGSRLFLGLLFEIDHEHSGTLDFLGRTIDLTQPEPDADSADGSERPATLALRSSDPLVVALSSPVYSEVTTAIRALAKRADPDAIEALVEMLDHQEWAYRALTVIQLGKIESPSVLEPLIAKMDDKIYRVRDAAVKMVVKRLPEPHAAEALNWALNDPDSEARTRIVAALGKTKSPAVLELLIARLDDDDETVRQVAVGALGGHVPAPRAVEALNQALGDPSPYVRREALEQHSAHPDDFSEVEGVTRALKDEDRDVREAAATALTGRVDARSLRALREALDDEYWEVRRDAALALGGADDPIVITALIALLDDREGYVRQAAATSLGKTGNPAAIEALGEQLRQSKINHADLILALAQINDPRAVDLLIKTVLGHENDDARARAAEALHELDDPRAAEALEQAKTDPAGSVRYAAAGRKRKRD